MDEPPPFVRTAPRSPPLRPFVTVGSPKRRRPIVVAGHVTEDRCEWLVGAAADHLRQVGRNVHTALIGEFATGAIVPSGRDVDGESLGAREMTHLVVARLPPHGACHALHERPVGEAGEGAADLGCGAYHICVLPDTNVLLCAQARKGNE